ncbi:MAG: hypothetical protein D6732_21635 [Methanobacteriota archaeon]|nr:MAG: hypothetical protein D6732_21635 [Euryarchaeota archaeon]
MGCAETVPSRRNIRTRKQILIFILVLPQDTSKDQILSILGSLDYRIFDTVSSNPVHPLRKIVVFFVRCDQGRGVLSIFRIAFMS